MSKTMKNVLGGIVITVGGAFLVGAGAWAHNIDKDNTRHEERLGHLKEDVDTLKTTVGDISDKVNFLAAKAGYKPKGLAPPFDKAEP